MAEVDANTKAQCSISTVVVSLDGAYILMRDDGYREAMVGNLSLYDVTGKQQHTVYLGGCPRIETYCGKADFGSFFRLNSLNTTSIRLILIEKMTSKPLSLATASILGQPPRRSP